MPSYGSRIHRPAMLELFDSIQSPHRKNQTLSNISDSVQLPSPLVSIILTSCHLIASQSELKDFVFLFLRKLLQSCFSICFLSRILYVLCKNAIKMFKDFFNFVQQKSIMRNQEQKVIDGKVFLPEYENENFHSYITSKDIK
jgi:hypothetical protein